MGGLKFEERALVHFNRLLKAEPSGPIDRGVRRHLELMAYMCAVGEMMDELMREEVNRR